MITKQVLTNIPQKIQMLGFFLLQIQLHSQIPEEKVLLSKTHNQTACSKRKKEKDLSTSVSYHMKSGDCLDIQPFPSLADQQQSRPEGSYQLKTTVYVCNRKEHSLSDIKDRLIKEQGCPHTDILQEEEYLILKLRNVIQGTKSVFCLRKSQTTRKSISLRKLHLRR